MSFELKNYKIKSWLKPVLITIYGLNETNTWTTLLVELAYYLYSYLLGRYIHRAMLFKLVFTWHSWIYVHEFPLVCMVYFLMRVPSFCL